MYVRFFVDINWGFSKSEVISNSLVCLYHSPLCEVIWKMDNIVSLAFNAGLHQFRSSSNELLLSTSLGHLLKVKRTSRAFNVRLHQFRTSFKVQTIVSSHPCSSPSAWDISTTLGFLTKESVCFFFFQSSSVFKFAEHPSFLPSYFLRRFSTSQTPPHRSSKTERLRPFVPWVVFNMKQECYRHHSINTLYNFLKVFLLLFSLLQSKNSLIIFTSLHGALCLPVC